MVSPRKQQTNRIWKQGNAEHVREYQREYRAGEPMYFVVPQGAVDEGHADVGDHDDDSGLGGLAGAGGSQGQTVEEMGCR